MWRTSFAVVHHTALRDSITWYQEQPLPRVHGLGWLGNPGNEVTTVLQLLSVIRVPVLVTAFLFVVSVPMPAYHCMVVGSSIGGNVKVKATLPDWVCGVDAPS